MVPISQELKHQTQQRKSEAICFLKKNLYNFYQLEDENMIKIVEKGIKESLKLK